MTETQSTPETAPAADEASRLPWRPLVEEGAYPSLEEIVGQAIGTGSMCWLKVPTGVFDDAAAKWVAEGAAAAIKRTIKLDARGGLKVQHDVGPQEGFDDTDYEKLRMQDKLYMIRQLTEHQAPFGSDLANFRRRLQLILGA